MRNRENRFVTKGVLAMYMDKDYLLTTNCAKRLFWEHAVDQPIIDYHCHLVPQQIYEDRNFNNISEAWLTEGNHYGDHYKWRLMRANGTPEELVTGNGDPREKFRAFAAALDQAWGNPVFEWCHMELRYWFGINDVLTSATADDVYDRCNTMLATPEFSRKNLIRRARVKALTTTDDPIDDLHYHELLAAQEQENGFKVLPGFRPDKALNIDRAGFAAYMEKLVEVSGVAISTFGDIVAALTARIDYFAAHGCSICDHAMDSVVYAEATDAELDAIVAKALAGEALSAHEVAQYRSALIAALLPVYHERNWTNQFHMHALRDLNSARFAEMGSDTGFDSINDEPAVAVPLARLLDGAYRAGKLHRTILYSLNPADMPQLVTVMQCFQANEDGVAGKVQLGTAWWFNDTRNGMRAQLKALMDGGLLGHFVGMLTDSRSFMSYPRHEYFRRVLCELLGEMVERGQIPADEKRLGELVENVSFNNAAKYFGFLND